MNENQNGNQNLNIRQSNNGEGTPSSLSAVNSGDRNNANMAAISRQRAATPHGMRADDYKRSHVGSLDNARDRGANETSQQAFNRSMANNRTRIANARREAAQELVKNYASAHGASNGRSMDTSVGQTVMNKALKRKSLGRRAFDSIMNRGGDDTDPSKKNESEKTAAEKSDEKEQKKVQNGEITFELPVRTMRIAVIVSVITCLFVTMTVVVASLAEEKVSSLVIAGMVAKDKGKQIIKEVTGKGSGEPIELVVGKAGDDEFPKSYYDRLNSLGNLYSSQQTCTGKDCLNREEFLYYLKIADISIRYKNKYNVELDWYLIAATDLYFAKSTEDTMRANLSDYDKDNVENYNVLSELDWDNDFKKMPGYKYLDASDSRYDLNILAKNMVKKKTIQTCTNSNGTVQRQEDEDVEDMYFELGAEKRLSCGAGSTYNISSTYTLDKDKFDEFLLEYIDKKMYTPGSGGGNTSSSSGNSLSNAFVSLAVAQLKDPSASGGEKYWRHMGWNHRIAWCAAFVSWNIANASYGDTSLKDIITKQTAAVYEFMNFFYNSNDSNVNFKYNDNCSSWKGKNGSGTYTPKEGDLIFFDWIKSSGNTRWNGTMPTCYGCGADHVGIVQRVENGNIITIEGNTGDAVHERSYPINSCEVIGFGSWY